MTYDWPRFWIPREKVDRIRTGDFLYDPQGEYKAALSPGVVSLGELAEHPLLILLGEPASGKSQAVAEYVEELGLADSPSNEEVPPRYRLNAEPGTPVFALRNEFRSFGEIPATEIFLDSVDEVTIIDMERFIPELIRESFRKKTRLRIVCRTASLTPQLEDAIRQTSTRLGIVPQFYVLAQLRESDATTIANALELDSAAFLSEINRLQARGFAAQAGTLCAMAEVFGAFGSLPERLWDLWEEQMRLTVSLARGQTVGTAMPAHDDRACLNLLSRVAAATIFGDRSGIASHQVVVASEGLLRINQVADHPGEAWDDGETADSDEMTRIVNLAPLSTGVDPAVIGWPTRPPEEFLATRYLLSRGLGIAQLRELLTDREQSRIVPQLHQVATLLSTRNEAFFDFVIKHDPHLALRGDVGAASPERRVRLAHHLLAAIEEGYLTWSESHDVGYALVKLAGIDLTATIRPFLATSNRIETRAMAVEMAGATHTVALLSDLLQILVQSPRDTNELDLTLSALRAIGQLTPDSKSRAPIVPTLLELADRPPLPIDPDHAVLGELLGLLWPDHLSVSALLTRLVAPVFRTRRDSYRDFLRYRLPTQAPDEDLVTLIHWARSPFGTSELEEEGEETDSSTRFPEAVVRESYRRLDVPGVIDALALYVADGAEDPQHRHWFWEPDPFHSESMRRRTAADFPLPSPHERLALAFAILERIAPPDPSRDFGRHYLWQGLAKLVGRENLRPLMEVASNSDPRAPFALELLRRLATREGDRDVILNHLGRNDRFDATFALWRVEPALTSSLPETEAPSEDSSATLEKGLSALDASLLRVESTGSRDYLRVQDLLWSLGARTRSISLRNMRITDWPGWNECAPDLRRRMLDAAERFVRESGSVTERVPHLTYPFDLAGTRALRLLAQEGRQMPAEVWRRWTVAVLSISAGHDDPEQEALQRQAFEFDRDRAVAYYLEAMRTQSIFHVPRLIEPYLLADLGEALAEVRASFTSEVRRTFYKDLHRLKHPKLLSWLREDWSASTASGIVSLADLLALVGNESDGLAVLQKLSEENDTILSLLTTFAAHFDTGEFLARPFFSVPLLERLAQELIDRYPRSEDPQYPGAHSWTERDRLGELRGAVIARLGSMSGDAALDAIRRLRVRYENIAWIEDHYRRALRNRVMHAWCPIVPADLRIILSDPDRILIRSNDELLAAAIASIERFQVRLDALRLRWVFWREIVRRKTKEEPEQVSLEPYVEERASDLIMEHLDRDLRAHAVIGNREAIVGRGERHDIRLEIRRRDGDRIVDHKIVIEVKLGTNNGVKTSMQSQLRDRYLTEGQTSHGLYLVLYTGLGGEPLWEGRRLDADGWRSVLRNQAEDLSDQRMIQATVLDISLLDSQERFNSGEKTFT